MNASKALIPYLAYLIAEKQGTCAECSGILTRQNNQLICQSCGWSIDIPAVHHMSYFEMRSLFSRYEMLHQHEPNHPHLTGYIVFTPESYGKPYTEVERTYIICSADKAFQPNMGGYSLYGSSLDGKDRGVRLDQYMKDESSWGKWITQDCYMFGDLPELPEPELPKKPAAKRAKRCYKVEYALKMNCVEKTVTVFVSAATAAEAKQLATADHLDRYAHYPKAPHMFRLSAHVHKEANE